MEWDLKRAYAIGLLSGSGSGIEDVYKLWVEEAGLGEDEARRRLSEVALVGTDPDAPCAASRRPTCSATSSLGAGSGTSAPSYPPSTAPATLPRTCSSRPWALTRERFASGHHPEAPGAIIEIDSPELQRSFREAVWMPTRFYFIGENPSGGHVRVHWFPGARTPAPPASYSA